MSTKVIEVEDTGFVWAVPLSAIADHRAKYYAERDEDTTYQEEFDFVMEDDFEGIDWFANNMDWSDVADKATLIKSPDPLAEPDMSTASKRIVSRA